MIECSVLNSRPESVRNVRLYLTGLVASLLGDSAMSVVAGIWTKDLTGSNRTAGPVSICVFLPSLLAPVTGLLADRFRRRPFLIAANLAAAAVVLALLAVEGAAQTWLLFAVMSWYGLTIVTIDPAETALLTELLPPERLGRLNGLRMTLQEGCKLIAPLGGAALYALTGGRAVAILDAVSFLVAAACVAGLRLDERPPPPRESHWRAEITAGLRHVRADHPLTVLITGGAIAMIVSGLAFPSQYALVDALHRPASFIGVLTALLGVGSIVAGLLSGRVMERVGARRLAGFGCVAAVVSYLLMSTGSLLPVVAGSTVRGAALPWIVIAVITAAQQRTPGALQGRVSATVTLALFATQPVVTAAGALLIDPVGYRGMYLGAATGFVLLGAFLLIGPVERRPGRSVEQRPRATSRRRCRRAA